MSELATVTAISSGRWRRRVMLASVAALVAGSVVSAAAAEVLPNVVQRPLAAIVNALTPFDLHPLGPDVSGVGQTPYTVGPSVSPLTSLPVNATSRRGRPISIVPTSSSPTILGRTTIPAPTTLVASTTEVVPEIVPEIVSPNQDKPMALSTSIPPGRHTIRTLVNSEPVATVLSDVVHAPKTHRKTKASRSKAAPDATPTPDSTQPRSLVPPSGAHTQGNTQGNRTNQEPKRGGTGDQNKSDNAKHSGKPTEPTDRQPPVIAFPAIDDHGVSTKSNGNAQQPSDPPAKRADK